MTLGHGSQPNITQLAKSEIHLKKQGGTKRAKHAVNEKNPDPVSGMNIPDLIFEKDRDPRSLTCQPWIQDGKNRIRDPG